MQAGPAALISEQPQSLLSIKSIEKTLQNKDFAKKKLDTNRDTHCIKIGVQLWNTQPILRTGYAHR